MIKILKYMKKTEWLFILISVVFIVAQVFLDLKMPDYMNDISLKVELGGGSVGGVLSSGYMMLLCALGSLVSSVIVAVFAARVASNLAKRLRELEYGAVMSFSSAEMNKFSTASLITRSTNDITQVQMFFALGFQVLIKAPITAAWAVTKISGKSWEWTLATGGAVAFLIVMISVIVIFAIPKFRKIQTLTDNLNRVARENLTGIRVVRAYNAEEYQEEKFDKANSALTRTYLFTTRVMSIMMPAMSLIMSGLSLSIYWIGAYLINAADMMSKGPIFADMITFMIYAMQVVMSFMMLSMIFIMLPRASVAAKRVLEVILTKSTITDGAGNGETKTEKGRVEFRDVFFKYPDASDYTLKNISFTASPGETVAFIGATGSGKSTLINLLPRFYDATKGRVLVGGEDVRDYPIKKLRQKLGYVPQKAVMFSGSVRSNVAFGDNSSASETQSVADSVATAQAKDFVESRPGGYDGDVARGGLNLSGGQKQRLSIARALNRNPEILIFDDTFSALDYKTDKLLRSSLKSGHKQVTTLVVAQRIGTIRDADKIIVLEEGEIAGTGTHAELMENCPVYREIAMSQLSKEELS
ncbi:MAG: ABC transporter ATP-binding protein [Eubacteriales bacterium]